MSFEIDGIRVSHSRNLIQIFKLIYMYHRLLRTVKCMLVPLPWKI